MIKMMLFRCDGTLLNCYYLHVRAEYNVNYDVLCNYTIKTELFSM